VRTTSTGGDTDDCDGMVTLIEAEAEVVHGDTLEGLSLAEKNVIVEYIPKLSIGDDGSFVPELYEGMVLNSICLFALLLLVLMFHYLIVCCLIS
jgi:hypothetical protein